LCVADGGDEAPPYAEHDEERAGYEVTALSLNKKWKFRGYNLF
jgi:hypothetical protein